MDGTPRAQVYNTEKDAKEVNSFNITLHESFASVYRYGRVYVSSENKRTYIHLVYKTVVDGKRYTGGLLSRYLYTIHHGEIPETHEVDHRDGNKFNDRIENLVAIQREHNYLKSNYGYYWLPKYNEVHGTNYIEQDLLDIELLNRVIAYVDTIRPNARKEMRASYYRENSEKLKQDAREYREKNKEHVLKRDREYHHRNKEYRNAQKKEYWAKTKHIHNLKAKERRVLNKELYKEGRLRYVEANRDLIREKKKEYREKNADIIKRKKSLLRKLDGLRG